jgi:hypothetical protein
VDSASSLNVPKKTRRRRSAKRAAARAAKRAALALVPHTTAEGTARKPEDIAAAAAVQHVQNPAPFPERERSIYCTERPDDAKEN